MPTKLGCTYYLLRQQQFVASYYKGCEDQLENSLTVRDRFSELASAMIKLVRQQLTVNTLSTGILMLSRRGRTPFYDVNTGYAGVGQLRNVHGS